MKAVADKNRKASSRVNVETRESRGKVVLSVSFKIPRRKKFINK